MKQTDKQADR